MKALASLLVMLPALAVAHPLGNVTTNRWARLTVARDAVQVHWVVAHGPAGWEPYPTTECS